MADERDDFVFSAGELGIVSTNVIDAGENFLNSDPNNITVVPPRTKKKSEEDEDTDNENEVPGESSKKKTKAEQKSKIKEVVSESREISDNDAFSLLEKSDKQKSQEEDENEEEEERIPPSTKKKDISQKLKEKTKEIEEREENEENEENNEGEDKESEDQENIFKTLTKELVVHGIFLPEYDDEGNELEIDIDSPEKFHERFQLETRRQAADNIEKFLSKHGQEYRDMFENVFVRGIDPVEYLNRYTRIESVKGIDLADENNQEKVVRELYRSEKRSPEYIDKKIGQLKNYGDLATEAEEAQRILVEREEEQNERAAQEKQIEIDRRNQIRNEYVVSMNKIISDKLKSKEFDNIPVNDRFANEIFGYLTQERWQNGKQLLTDFDKDILELNRPTNHELKVKIAMLLKMAKEDPKLTKLSNKAVSKESNELFRGLKKASAKSRKESQGSEERRSFVD